MGIFSRFGSARSSIDYATLEADQVRLLAETKEQLAAMTTERVEAIAAGDDDRVAALREQIRGAKEQLEELGEAIAVAGRRRGEAEERETAAKLEERSARQRILRDSVVVPMMQEAYVLAAELAAFAPIVRERIAAFDAENKALRAAGRPDLAVELPMRDWNDTVRAQRIEESLQRQRARGNPDPSVPANLQPGALMSDIGVLPWAGPLHIPGLLATDRDGAVSKGRPGGFPHWLEVIFPHLATRVAAGGAARRKRLDAGGQG